MITSYKESSTKEELNKKPIKHGHPTPHLYLMARTTHRYLHITLSVELVFDAACFQSRSLVRVVRNIITWLIYIQNHPSVLI